MQSEGYSNGGDPEHAAQRTNANLAHGWAGTAEVVLMRSDCGVYGYDESPHSDRLLLLLSHNGSTSDCSLTKSVVLKVRVVDVGQVSVKADALWLAAGG